MRVKMLETRRGTEDGYTIRKYYRNEEYEMSDSLARAFLAAGFAVRVLPDNRPKASAYKPRKKTPRPQLVVDN